MIYINSSVPLNCSLVAIWRVTFFFNQCWTRLASFLGNFLLSNSRLHASINSFSVDSDHPVENQTWRIDLDLAWFKIIWYRTLHLTIDTMEESTPEIEQSIFLYESIHSWQFIIGICWFYYINGHCFKFATSHKFFLPCMHI